jgi:glycosyltransferase involved in cell wall biosynthesis
LKIAVNTRLLIKNKLEGIGWFTHETLKRIVIQHPEVDFYFFFDRQPYPEFIYANNVTPIVLHPQARHPFLFFTWFEWSVANALRRLKPDLFLSPDGYISLSTTTPTLAVMHDLNFEHFPKDLPWLVRHYYRFFFPRFAKKSKRIGTVSHFSKYDISRAYGINSSKIDVIYNGINEAYKPVDTQTAALVRKAYTRGEPYFLFVGSLQPRKNLARLFAAFDLFRCNNKTGVKLLVVGEKKWWTAPIGQAFDKMKHQHEVIFCGRLGAEELQLVTASALATTYVSYFEGFGIPIVESFKCGVPVITSNVTSMPEVAGDAALLIDPFDIESIARAMQTLATDIDLRKTLISKGLERAALFTWQQTADALWDSILKTIEKE